MTEGHYNYKSKNDIPIRTNLRGSELLNTPAVSTPDYISPRPHVLGFMDLLDVGTVRPGALTM